MEGSDLLTMPLLLGGLFGISLKKMFRNPFGKHSLFGKATQLASVLPIPGAGLVGKAFGLLNRGRNVYQRLQGVAGPVLTAARAASLVPSQAPVGVMPGGVRVAARRRPTTHRNIARHPTVRRRRRTTKRRRRR